jgi:hypothetical protein
MPAAGIAGDPPPPDRGALRRLPGGKLPTGKNRFARIHATNNEMRFHRWMLLLMIIMRNRDESYTKQKACLDSPKDYLRPRGIVWAIVVELPAERRSA